jgi:CHAT domain-containing protein
MSVEEARQVTISMDNKSITAPPRRIDDILAVLNQSAQDDLAIRQKLRAEIDKSPPQTDNPARLAVYYHRRGDAFVQLGRHSQALADLRQALDYSLQAGGPDHKLLKSLAVAEFSSGNFKHAIELFEQSLNKKERPSTYNMLVKLYTRVGDLESAQWAANRGIILCNSLRNQKGWGKWPVILAAYMKAMVLEAQGKFAEAEPHYRQILRNWSPSMQQKNPLSYIVHRIYLTRNLKNQDRLVEAEVEARDTLKVVGALDRESEVFGTVVGELGEILLRQGRLRDAAKIMSAGVGIMQEAKVSPDSYLMGEGRMRLGEVLTAEQKYDEAMRQFDFARSGMQQNQYLYENFFARNPALMLALLRTGRIQEATGRISAVLAQNRRLLGDKHYLTAEALAFRGMLYALQESNQQALRDFSEALPILIEKSSGETFAYDRKLRLKTILESYLGLLAKVQGSRFAKNAGIDATAEGFKLADALSGSTLHGAIGASTARAAVTSEELADLVRKEQDAQNQLKLMQTALTENLVVPREQQLPEVIKELKTKIDTLSRARQVLTDEINTRFPKYAELIHPKPVSISQLQKHLHPGEVLISIYLADDQSYVWAIAPEGEAVFSTVPLGRKRLSQMVIDLRRSLDPKPITLGDIPTFDTTTAYDLYRKLLKPVEKGWESAKDLLIVAHGPLGQLPFAVLPTAPVSLGEEQELFGQYRKVPWLIRKTSVTRLPSASTFVNLRSVAAGDPMRRPFAGFGDPLFNPQQLASAKEEKAKPAIVAASQPGQINVRGIRISEEGILDNDKIVSCTINNLKRLPDTSTEIKHIAKALGANPSDDVFLGRQASEQQVKSMDLSDRKVIAFATHALVPGDLDGLNQPALALSSPSIAGNDEDGLLTMTEILRLKLNADWVVLSACNTGAAEGRGAEAISGLGRAFFYAGTRAVLVSMWPVETTSARELTTGLFRYQQADQNLSRARALQKSALALIDGPGFKDPASGKIAASYAHPLFWAPFIVVGESGKNAIGDKRQVSALDNANTKHENEKKRQTEEAAQIERERQELEQLREEFEKKQRLQEEKKRLEEENLKLASIPEAVTAFKILLRKKPIMLLSEKKINNMLVKYGFYDRSRNPRGSFENVFVNNNDDTVTDKSTELMWQKSGSAKPLENRGAKEYVRQLNKQLFAGHSDWRMPTIEELASLLKKDRRNGVHIDPVFNNNRIRCWSVNQRESQIYSWFSGAWIVDFKKGTLLEADWVKPAKTGFPSLLRKNNINYVKAVRSVK